jgi:formylmethanofuran dehydrogenase subunit D
MNSFTGLRKNEEVVKNMYKTHIDESGSMQLTPEMLNHIGVSAGDKVTVELKNPDLVTINKS